MEIVRDDIYVSGWNVTNQVVRSDKRIRMATAISVLAKNNAALDSGSVCKRYCARAYCFCMSTRSSSWLRAMLANSLVTVAEPPSNTPQPKTRLHATAVSSGVPVSGQSASSIDEKANPVLARVHCWGVRNKLTFAPSKTKSDGVVQKAEI
ncbi:hypothetical protein EVAR_87195_1 [Eumeta japonica]|uniref:Uncharacterized protein n=1 Tax=Eumeta variegata TaxID=151549 RepID=A0A4C1VXJ5_EUMVA|nr:hypothetical protein EVAR_87195_1 [Eumeta japonica]